MKEKIIGLIPARMGSSRFPGKPIAKICGKPMIYWVYNQAKKVDRISELYVITPDDEIYDTCLEYNIPCLLDRRQASTAAEKLAMEAQKLSGDIYLNIQGDEPLIEPYLINQIIDELLSSDNNYVGFVSKIDTEEEHENRNNVKVVLDENDYAMYFSRSPIPNMFEYGSSYRVLGLYGYSKDVLTQYLNVKKSKLESLESGIEMIRMIEKGYKIKFLHTDYKTIGVDLEEHIQIVEKELRKRGI